MKNKNTKRILYDIDEILVYIKNNYLESKKTPSYLFTPYSILDEKVFRDCKKQAEYFEIWEKNDVIKIILDYSKTNDSWKVLKKRIDSYFSIEINQSHEGYLSFFDNEENQKDIKNLCESFKNFINSIKNFPKIDDINDSISKVFKGKTGYLTPGFYSPKQLNENAEILFVGMNPAGEYKNKKGEIIYNKIKTEVLEVDKADIIKAHDKFFDYTTFFAPFEKMFGHFYNGRWNHIDIFAVRGTNQDEIVVDIEKNKKFYLEQYEIFVKLVNLLQPKIIIVSNAGASNFLKDTWNWKDEKGVLKREMYDEENGYWITPISGAFDKQYPLIFTGMLSGQRALDFGSRDILQFHIEKILKYIKK